MKKTLIKLFITFSLLLAITSNVTPASLDVTDTTNYIEAYSNIPFDDGKLE